MPELRLPAVIAHRGASSSHPENTLSAFEAAVQAGADMIELDVRLTADEVLVVTHDPDLVVAGERIGFVHELTLEQVRRATGGGEPGTGVPALQEALELLRGRAGLEIEIKNDPDEPAFEPAGARATDAVLRLVEELRFRALLVASFDRDCIDRVRRRAPDVPTGLLVEQPSDLAAALDDVAARGHAFLLPDAGTVERTGPEFVERAHAAGVRLAVWTVNEPQAVQRLFAWGVDAVESDDPAMAVRARAANAA